MSEITTTNVWPSTLPLPSIDWQGSMNPPVAISPPKSARSARRRRWKTGYGTGSLSWAFTRLQLIEFKEFWTTTLGHGAARFEIDLRFPKISALSTWVVQIVSDLESATDDNEIIIITCAVQIQRLKALDDKASALENLFLVQGAGSSAAGPEQFFVQGVGSSAAEPVPFAVQEE